MVEEARPAGGVHPFIRLFIFIGLIGTLAYLMRKAEWKDLYAQIEFAVAFLAMAIAVFNYNEVAMGFECVCKNIRKSRKFVVIWLHFFVCIVLFLMCLFSIAM